MSEPRFHTPPRAVLGGGAAAVLAVFSAVVACGTTDDPRAGTRASTGTSSGGAAPPSGGGGIDAAAPAGPLECGPAPHAEVPFTKQALLGAAADCAAWRTCHFVNAATTLRTNVRAHATTPSDAALAAARSSWRTAMDAWSALELFQFGPVASKILDPYHGRGIRSFIQPWPQTNRCEVEKQVATKGWQQGMETVLPAGRGLFALEYLLFYPGSDTACLAAGAAGQAWATLSPAALAAAKGAYGGAVADNLVALALELRNVWLPAGENFKSKLLALDGYGTEQEALNVVAWALYYVEEDVKDLKLAPRAGVTTTDPIPETPFAGVDVENVRTNLRSFRSLFQGCGADGAGLGFDDWLVAAGHGELATDTLVALANAEAAADAFPPFAQASQAQFRQLYDVVKVLTDLLKTRFFGSASPLNLKLPATAASDTD